MADAISRRDMACGWLCSSWFCSPGALGCFCAQSAYSHCAPGAGNSLQSCLPDELERRFGIRRWCWESGRNSSAAEAAPADHLAKSILPAWLRPSTSLFHKVRERLRKVPQRLLCAHRAGDSPNCNCECYTTQSRVGSFTYKRFTVPQEVHRSAKRLSLFSLSDHPKKRFFFPLQMRPGRTSPPPPEAETVRPLMSCEPPQCSHVLLGMRKYSP